MWKQGRDKNLKESYLSMERLQKRSTRPLHLCIHTISIYHYWYKESSLRSCYLYTMKCTHVLYCYRCKYSTCILSHHRFYGRVIFLCVSLHPACFPIFYMPMQFIINEFLQKKAFPSFMLF